MGSGRWSTDVYDAAARYRAGHRHERLRLQRQRRPHACTPRSTRTAWRCGRAATATSTRESTPIAVLFDVTGSMGGVPRVLQTKLPQLLGLLLRKGYATDPQILFGAIGDATCDRVPLQVGQFESDNRMDDDLGRIVLEGGGGGQTDRVLRAGDVLHGPAHRHRLLREARPARLPVHHRRRDGLPAGQARARSRGVIGDELARGRSRSRRSSPSCSADYDVYYILPGRGRLRRRHARSSASGASCSARTSSSWTTSTRSARRSR